MRSDQKEKKQAHVTRMDISTLSVATPEELALTGTLLDFVARGQHKEAKSLLSKFPKLSWYKGTVTDLSNQTFQSITAFQYAVRALDRDMWELLLPYLPEEKAIEQLVELEEKGTEHGKQYNFLHLIKPLQTFIENFNDWDDDKRSTHWSKVVGGAQQLAPVHVVNEYLRTDRAFYPIPDFKERSLPRKLCYYNFSTDGGGRSETTWYSDPTVGKSCAILRSNEKNHASSITCYFDRYLWNIKTDLMALTALSQVRTDEWETLRFNLLKSHNKQILVSRLLHHVVRGEQKEAEALLLTYPTLALSKGTVTDFSGKTFHDITALQYAIWAWDKHMWSMLLKYLSASDARDQLIELESKGTEHGKHYDFVPLLTALQLFINHERTWDINKLKDHWCKVVGGAQRNVPVHIGNEYCHPTKSFQSAGRFNEESLARVYNFRDYTIGGQDWNWFPLFACTGLGHDFAVSRAHIGAFVANLTVSGLGAQSVQSDKDGLNALYQTRANDLNVLKKQLSIPTRKVKRLVLPVPEKRYQEPVPRNSRLLQRRAYPVNNEAIAVSAIRNELLHNSHSNFTYAHHLKDQESHRWNSFHSEAGNLILPNGFFFCLNTYTKSTENYKIVHHDMELRNAFSGMGSHTLAIKESLNPTLAALIDDKPSNPTLGCVNKARNELFLYYPIDDGHTTIHFWILDVPSFDVKQSKLKPFYDEKSKVSHTGFSAYQTKYNNKIIAITGIVNFENANVAMALDTGEIIVGKASDRKFQELSIIKPTIKSNNITLLANQDGVLIAHDTEKNKLYKWNLKLGPYYVQMSCDNIYHLNMATSGQYLTALEYQGGEMSNTVHCYALPSMQHTTFKLDAPIADIAIGPGNEVFLLNSHESFLQNYHYPGTIESLLVPKAVLEERHAASLQRLGVFPSSSIKPKLGMDIDSIVRKGPG